MSSQFSPHAPERFKVPGSGLALIGVTERDRLDLAYQMVCNALKVLVDGAQEQGDVFVVGLHRQDFEKLRRMIEDARTGRPLA